MNRATHNRAVIFAAGDLIDTDRVRAVVDAEDLVIAADGGVVHAHALGIAPDVVVGDFDSAMPERVKAASADGAEVIVHPARKDATDLELALLLAVDRGAEEVLILGAMGGRWDQSLANLLLPCGEAFADIAVRLFDGVTSACWLHGPAQLEFAGSPGDTVSLVPLSGSAEGITTRGLTYRLDGGRLEFGSTRGVSNVMTDDTCAVQIQSGRLLCVHISIRHQPE